MQPLFSYSYSVPYLLLSLSLLFLSLNELGKLHVIDKKNSRYIAFILMLFFIGFRGHIKTDFINYYPYFNNLPIITDLKIGCGFSPHPNPLPKGARGPIELVFDFINNVKGSFRSLAWLRFSH